MTHGDLKKFGKICYDGYRYSRGNWDHDGLVFQPFETLSISEQAHWINASQKLIKALCHI